MPQSKVTKKILQSNLEYHELRAKKLQVTIDDAVENVQRIADLVYELKERSPEHQYAIEQLALLKEGLMWPYDD